MITLKDIMVKLSEDTFFSKKDLANLADKIVDRITLELETGETVKLTTIGTLRTMVRKARKGVNPRNLEPMDIPEQRVISFKVSATLKRALNP